MASQDQQQQLTVNIDGKDVSLPSDASDALRRAAQKKAQSKGLSGAEARAFQRFYKEQHGETTATETDPQKVHDARVARFAQSEMKGDGPAAHITGPNISDLRAWLQAQEIELTDDGYKAAFGTPANNLRTFAYNGTEKPLKKEAASAIRALVKKADEEKFAGVSGNTNLNARTFYGQKVVRMLVAILTDAQGKLPAEKKENGQASANGAKANGNGSQKKTRSTKKETSDNGQQQEPQPQEA